MAPMVIVNCRAVRGRRDPLCLEQPCKARVGPDAPFIVLHLPWLRPLAQAPVHRTWTPLKKQALLRV